MSEGKLKKEINDLRFDKDILRKHPAVVDIFKLEIYQLLDEAKKEFPTCSTCKFYLKDKDTCPFSALGEDCCPKTDWFKKWFGDTKQ